MVAKVGGSRIYILFGDLQQKSGVCPFRWEDHIIWPEFFARFYFTQFYQPSSNKLKPDALSCQFKHDFSSSSPTNMLLVPPPRDVEPKVKEILKDVVVLRGCLLRWPFVPPPLWSQVMHWAHFGVSASHLEIKPTMFIIDQRFWWLLIDQEVAEYVACPVCARNNSPRVFYSLYPSHTVPGLMLPQTLSLVCPYLKVRPLFFQW